MNNDIRPESTEWVSDESWEDTEEPDGKSYLMS